MRQIGIAANSCCRDSASQILQQQNTGKMLSWRILVFCTLLIVQGSSQSVLDLNFGSFIHSPIRSVGGKEETAPRLLYRHKRQDGITPEKHTIAIEITFGKSLLQEAIRSYLNNISFPLLVNLSNSAVNISSITVSTACNTTGNNNTHCYCEHGYVWPAKTCAETSACHKTPVAPEDSCICIAQLPPQGTYCQFQSEGISLTYKIRMSVTLKIPFETELNNVSSTLYKQYKHDLENAFTIGYGSLPGFKHAVVKGFRPGSIIVDYELTAGRATPLENANKKVAESLNSTYNLDPTSFIKNSTVIPGATNLSVSPEYIFNGDTVTMTCEASHRHRLSSNASWYLSGRLVSTGSRHSIMNGMTDGRSVSTLKITSITSDDAGDYTCTFTEEANGTILIYEGWNNITVFPIIIVPSEAVEIVCDGERRELSCCTDREIHLFHSYWKPNGAINISGTTNYTHNCTQYLLQANATQCPADKSGTVTVYTCELSTADGARNSKTISVTYLRVANVSISSSTNGSISAGHHFSLSCESDVTNYDKVTWQIQNGNLTMDIDTIWYTTAKIQLGVSVLTVGSANSNWNGTYICTFFQRNLNSSARMAIKVFPLPLKKDIIRSPIEAFISCPGSQALKCCIDGIADYSVIFSYSQSPPLIHAGKRDNNCYHDTIVVKRDGCNSAHTEFEVFCKFTNQIGGSVQSFPMKLQIVPVEKVMCNSSEIGIGEDKANITKPCLKMHSSNTGNTVRGSITYRCNRTRWDVARNSCLSMPVNNLLTAAESLVSSPKSVQQLPIYLQNLSQTVKEEQETINTSAANLRAVVEILNLVSVVPIEAKQETMEHFLSTVDSAISSPTETWKAFENGSSQLLDSIEQFSGSLQPINNTIPSIRYETLQLKGVVINESNISDYIKTFTFFKPSDLNGTVLIDEAKIKTLKQDSTIISVAYSTLGHIFPWSNKTDALILNGLVITTTVSASNSLTEDFSINMTFVKHERSLKKPQCVFWNFNFSADAGGWDDTGCNSKDNGDSVICSCNHLTSFTILMSPSDGKPSLEFSPLDYISYIGLSISVLSLVACIVIETVVWKSVTKTRISYMRHVSILNIAVSLLIAHVWFIVVAAMSDKHVKMDEIICTAATFFIHFFYLCVFFWMLTLGFMLFYHLVFIFHNASKTIMKAVGFCLGYGCPTVISVITVGITYPQHSYTRDNICILKWEKSKALLALVIPAMIIVVINLIITIVVIAKIPRRSIGENAINDERSSLYRITKSIGVLTPLLGLTWGFGLATVVPETPEVFGWLFTIFNAFQGVFILLCGILWDRKVREALLKKCSLSSWSSLHTKATSQGMSAPMLSFSSPFSRTLNNLFGKAGKYQVSSTESTATSSSESTSKAYSLLT